MQLWQRLWRLQYSLQSLEPKFLVICLTKKLSKIVRKINAQFIKTIKSMLLIITES
jgi:hypothetical protein